ncbi:MAG: DUF2007 domain-containing protein [candidate division Zixibacteria bacterium]|nr:DUF2007 domain-containing protein [candidate division Zixibacteria bacterium]
MNPVLYYITYQQGDAMFCPKCRAEYREGYTYCSDCEVALVAELPPEPTHDVEYVDLVTVFKAGDPVLTTLAKTILEEADIYFFAKGEGPMGLFGAGRSGLGFGPFVNDIEIQVAQHDAEEAIHLLQELENEE